LSKIFTRNVSPINQTKLELFRDVGRETVGVEGEVFKRSEKEQKKLEMKFIKPSFFKNGM
jgi:hypothetical protein